ncbi:dipeptide ABC transporter ATP-binding protein [Psychromonas sp. KJ10-10]|uniref:dipeptide ABC transporter ATP-binding protein n=1 Tax=Psychromonas sp. KJ10-10 TaxID=3391823 RepID=UPI0039B43A96
MNNLLSVEGLHIGVGQQDKHVEIVKDLNFTLEKGKTLCIAGESGSGKSLSSLAIMGLLPKAVNVSKGAINFDGKNLLNYSEKQMQKIRGQDIAMIFQEPMTSLNPLMTNGYQLIEAIRANQICSFSEAKKRALQIFDAVKIPQATKRFMQYPHEISGGMRQRVMIAIALACNPKILIADEPTTALDVTIQAQILTLLRELQQDFNTGVLMITHDMGVVAEMADDVIVMNKGIVEETGSLTKVFSSPESKYTQKLLNSVPKLGEAEHLKQIDIKQPVLEVTSLNVRFPIKKSFFNRLNYEVRAVNNLNFCIMPGETLGLVGESGCGKSTTGKAIMNLIDFEGSVRLNKLEMNGLSGSKLRRNRKNIQMIFQDPYASLNSRKRIVDLIAEPLILHKIVTKEKVRQRVSELLSQVGLNDSALDRYPHQFSGGQRQRISIARAIACEPKIIIADESVSALDVTVQAQILQLLQDLQSKLGISYLFISHDMAVIEQICHRVAVMDCGKIVEMGPTEEVVQNPRHNYTKRLMQAVPIAKLNSRRDFKSLLDIHELVNPIYLKNAEEEIVEYEVFNDNHHVALC